MLKMLMASLGLVSENSHSENYLYLIKVQTVEKSHPLSFKKKKKPLQS